MNKRRAKLFRIGRRLQSVARHGQPTPEKAEWFFRNFLRFERVSAGQPPFHNQKAPSVLEVWNGDNDSFIPNPLNPDGTTFTSVETKTNSYSLNTQSRHN